MKTEPLTVLTIDPLRIADRLAAAHHLQDPALAEEIITNPRLPEVMLFLQWCSDPQTYDGRPQNYRGGLRKLAADLAAASEDLLGTETMVRCGDRKLSEEERDTITSELPVSVGAALGLREGYTAGQFNTFYDDGRLSFAERDKRREEEALARAQQKRQTDEARLKARQALSRQSLLPHCLKAAVGLADHFATVCHTPGHSFSGLWYFPRVLEALLRFMDKWAEHTRGEIAETVITREVFRWLQKSVATGYPVRLEGKSRFGKTEAVFAFCKARPGIARPVATPSASAEGDFLRSIARALGIPANHRSKTLEMRAQCEHVLRQTRLMLVFDEAQWLMPVNVTRNTEPARLNWVRRSIIDAGIPTAFNSTPQSYKAAQTRLVRTTGYAMEQFNERILKTVVLPDVIGREDLMMIARKHFSGLPDKYLEYVVALARATERNFVSDVAKIACLAREYARDAGREKLTLQDIKTAIADVLPAAPAVRTLCELEPVRATPRKGVGKALSRPIQPACDDAAPARRFELPMETAASPG